MICGEKDLISKKTKITVGIFHGLLLLGRFGNHFNIIAKKRTNLKAILIIGSEQ